MATALEEREPETKKTTDMTEDEIHNSRIKANYEKLIHGDYHAVKSEAAAREEENNKQVYTRPADVYAPQVETRGSSVQEKTAQPDYNQSIHYVQNPSAGMRPENIARTYGGPTAIPADTRDTGRPIADSVLFTSDSPINKGRDFTLKIGEKPEINAEAETIDSTPTEETMKYAKTVNNSDSGKRESEKPLNVGTSFSVDRTPYGEGKFANTGHGHHTAMTRREKVAIGIVVSIIFALFVLVIVNSAVISSLSGEMSTLQSALEEARTVYTNASAQLEEVNDNIFSSMLQYVVENGGVAN